MSGTAQQAIRQAPPVTIMTAMGPRPVSEDAIEARLREACDVLRRLRVTIGHRTVQTPDGRMESYGSSWPSMVRDAWFAYSAKDDLDDPVAVPQGAEIDRMHETLAWLDWMSDGELRVVWSRLYVEAAWWKVAQRIRKSESTLKRWYKDGLRAVAKRLMIEDWAARQK